MEPATSRLPGNPNNLLSYFRPNAYVVHVRDPQDSETPSGGGLDSAGLQGSSLPMRSVLNAATVTTKSPFEGRRTSSFLAAGPAHRSASGRPSTAGGWPGDKGGSGFSRGS